MKITIGSDHRGYDLKTKIIQKFQDIEFLDVGTNSKGRVDYPVYADKVCQNILQKEAELGILICGSGVGVSIAANRFKKIYAGLCWNSEVAQSAREHDNINVLVLPADFVDSENAFSIIQTWLDAKFKGGVYQDRLNMID